MQQVQGSKVQPHANDTLIIRDSEDLENLKEILVENLSIHHTTAIKDPNTGDVAVTVYRDAAELNPIGDFTIRDGADATGGEVPDFQLGADYAQNVLVRSGDELYRALVAVTGATDVRDNPDWENVIALPRRTGDVLANPDKYVLDAAHQWIPKSDWRSAVYVCGVQASTWVRNSTTVNANLLFGPVAGYNDTTHPAKVTPNGRWLNLNPQYVYLIEPHIYANIEAAVEYEVASGGNYGTSNTAIGSGKATGGTGANDLLNVLAKPRPAKVVVSGVATLSLRNSSPYTNVAVQSYSQVIVTVIGKA